MKYLKYFELLADYEAYKSSSEYVTPNVSYVESESGLLYDPFVPSIDINNYCTFVALEDGFSASMQKASKSYILEYCIDGKGEWTILDPEAYTVAVNAGQTISFKGNLVNLNTEEGIGEFVTTKNFNAVGNVMSLLFGDNAATSYSLEGYNNIFKYLFSYNSLGNKNLISVSKNFLPATTLADFCYQGMFSGCTNLTAAPELPATTLANSCYKEMFRNCINLTAAPELPATTLEYYCYSYMFSGCTSLTTAPELPATELADYCYSGMFLGCTSLTSAPELPATTLADGCYRYMFSGCHSLTAAPELPATTLAAGCYVNMFQNCIKLNYIKMLATDISASTALLNWVENVAKIGTFIKLTNTKLPTGTSGIPEGWTIINEGDSNGDSNINLSDLFGDYTESFNDASYYGYPAKGILTIAESDKEEYDLKMTFFGGKPCAVTTYGILSNNGTQITTVQTSCNMGKFYPSTFNIDNTNGVVISGVPTFDYPTTVPDYVATKN